MTTSEFENYQLDSEVDAVVVGDDPKFTYAKIAIASLFIHDGGAKFIATNDDAYDMIGTRRMPGAGAMLAAIKQSLGTLDMSQYPKTINKDEVLGKTEPLVIGKPNPWAVELIR